MRKPVIVSMVILAFVVPWIVISNGVFKERQKKKELFAGFEVIFTQWTNASFVLISNKAGVNTCTDELLDHAAIANTLSLSQEQENALKDALLKTYLAYSTGEYSDYWEFRHPSTYKGVLHWNREELQNYKQLLPSPELVNKAIAEGKIDHPERVAGYSLKTDEDTFKYAWIAWTDSRTKKGNRVYSTDTWRSIAFDKSKVWIGAVLPKPSELAAAETNIGVYSTPPVFIPDPFEKPIVALRCNVKLLVSTIGFIDVVAYPVYIQYAYVADDHCWIPVEFAAGYTGKIQYIF